MEDTLRYFFSAIFQGIAAILTLGAMFYMNYQDKAKSRIDELVNFTRTFYSIPSEYRKVHSKSNIVEILKTHYENEKKDREIFYTAYEVINEYDGITSKLQDIKNIIPFLLVKGITLLIISSISLFAVGYHEYLNFVLFGTGLYSLFLIYKFLQNLEQIIVKSIDIDSIRDLSFMNLFKNYKSVK